VYADLPLLFCRSYGAAIRPARDGGLIADQFLSNVPSPTVGAAEGCDLLLLLVSNTAKRSQPRCTRQLLPAPTSSYGEMRTDDEPGRAADLISRMYQAVGAAEGCDLLLLLVSNTANRSQPRCTRRDDGLPANHSLQLVWHSSPPEPKTSTPATSAPHTTRHLHDCSRSTTLQWQLPVAGQSPAPARCRRCCGCESFPRGRTVPSLA